MRHSGKQNGYTLGQLLATLIIINLMAAFIGTAFTTYLKVAVYKNRQSCASNVKQISLALLNYTQDWDEIFPPCAEPIKNRMILRGWASLHDKKGAAFPETLTDWPFIEPYLKNDLVLLCPKDFSPHQQGRQVSYMVNDLAAGAAQKYFIAPQNTVLICDGENAAGNVGHSYAPNGQSLPPSFAADGTVLTGAVLHEAATRHDGGANYGFADGHVKWNKPNTVFFPLPADNSRAYKDQYGKTFGPNPLELPNKQWTATFHIK